MAACVAITGLWTLGCVRFPAENAVLALDYRIDRPRVVGVRLDPPVLAHGLPTSIDALILAPVGDEPHVTSVDICGLKSDVIVDVDAEDCFNQAQYVDHLADTVPATYDPPDMSAIPCPTYGYDTGTYGPPPPPYGDTAVDSGDTGAAPHWNVGACASIVPLMVSAKDGDVPFYGRVTAFFRVEPFAAGEYVPTATVHVAHDLTIEGDPVAGGTVDLTYRIAAAIDNEGFRWWVDDGELVGTGRTAVQERDGDWRITHNTLRIPADWHGPLRVYVVTEGYFSDNVPYTADLVWETTTLDVP